MIDFTSFSFESLKNASSNILSYASYYPKAILTSAVNAISGASKFVLCPFGFDNLSKKDIEVKSDNEIIKKVKADSNEKAANSTDEIDTIKNKSLIPFKDLPISDEQKDAFDTIYTGIGLGKLGGWEAFKKIVALAPALYAKRDVIHYHEVNGEMRGVFPLRHIAYVFSKEENRDNLKAVVAYNSFSFNKVKNRYLSEFSKVLKELQEKGKIEPYLKDFVDEVMKEKELTDEKKDELISSLKEKFEKIGADKLKEIFDLLLSYF